MWLWYQEKQKNKKQRVPGLVKRAVLGSGDLCDLCDQ